MEKQQQQLDKKQVLKILVEAFDKFLDKYNREPELGEFICFVCEEEGIEQ